MKMFRRLVIIFVAMFALANCNDSHLNSDVEKQKKTKFPSELAGTWITSDGIWLISFAPGGALISLKNYFTDIPIIVEEGGGYDFFEDGTVRSYYILGDYSVNYYEQNSVLSLEVKIDEFKVKRPGGEFTGWMSDKFEGKISSDEASGEKKWNVEWTNTTYFDQFEKSSDLERELIFTKVD